MKIIFTSLICLLSLTSYSQKVLISGFASDTTNGRNPVNVVVNDTIHRYKFSHKNDANVSTEIKAYVTFINNKELSVKTASDKSFSITVKNTDTLYFSSNRSISQKHAVADLLKSVKIDIHLEPQICKEYVPCRDTLPSNVYVFVGEKISVKEAPFYCNFDLIFDGEFDAVYKIVKNVYGKYNSDTIRFTARDHYGEPAFSNYKYVLLFVSEYCGKLIHAKYQYFDVYPTQDGRWASPGDPYRLDTDQKVKTIKAVPIIFANNLLFDINSPYYKVYQRQTQSYFKIQGNAAVPVMGAYVEDLLKIKKEGVLNARHIYLK